MFHDLTIANDNQGTIARDTINVDEEESRSRLENVGVRGQLSGVEREGTVLVHGEGVVELQEALTHVQTVCSETATNEDNGGVGGSIVSRSGV